MNRRSFLHAAAGATFARLAAAPAPRTDRLGCTTVSFRTRFPQTRPKTVTAPGPDWDLLDVPAYFVRELGIRQVEIWSRHVPAATPAYAARLRRAAEKAGAHLINLQLDEPPFDLSNPDAAKRQECLAATRKWMDFAAACGAPSLRANTGGAPQSTFHLPTTADSFRHLAEYGRKLGLRILVENHGGHSAQPENVAAIVRAVDSPWCRALADFGNAPARLTSDERLAFLAPLLPLAALVSAKGVEFDADYRHVSYDFGACVRAAERAGFTGTYSIELWAPSYLPPDPVRAVQSLASLIRENIG